MADEITMALWDPEDGSLTPFEALDKREVVVEKLGGGYLQFTVPGPDGHDIRFYHRIGEGEMTVWATPGGVLQTRGKVVVFAKWRKDGKFAGLTEADRLAVDEWELLGRDVKETPPAKGTAPTKTAEGQVEPVSLLYIAEDTFELRTLPPTRETVNTLVDGAEFHHRLDEHLVIFIGPGAGATFDIASPELNRRYHGPFVVARWSSTTWDEGTFEDLTFEDTVRVAKWVKSTKKKG